MESCVFCKIIRGELPCYKIWEDKNHLAFLSIGPVSTGHTLLIPKKHHPYLFEMPQKEFNQLLKASQPLSALLKKAFKPKTGRVGVIVAGMEVPHTHIHLIPMDYEGGLSLSNAKSSTPKQLQATLDLITKFR